MSDNANDIFFVIRIALLFAYLGMAIADAAIKWPK